MTLKENKKDGDIHGFISREGEIDELCYNLKNKRHNEILCYILFLLY